jgi:hypothetical protein
VKYLQKDCPIINIDALNMESVLEEYIRNKENIRDSYGLKLNWVKENHTIERNNLTLLKAWCLKEK